MNRPEIFQIRRDILGGWQACLSLVMIEQRHHGAIGGVRFKRKEGIKVWPINQSRKCSLLSVDGTIQLRA